MESIEPLFIPLRIGIIGLGLIGGSLAIALHGHCKSISGMDSDPATLALAKQLGIADDLSDDPSSIFPNCDVVILATPVNSILHLITTLPSLNPSSSIILDVGSTKTQIVNAMADLPERFNPIGGHPMCGKEKLSLVNADPAIFKGAPFVFVRLTRTRPNALKFAEELCQIIGAHPLWLDAETQDRWAASSSHLPYIIAAALVQSAPVEVCQLIGPGFRSTSRLASTPSSMMMDILATNRKNILEAVDQFTNSLEELKDLLKNEDYSGLEKLLSTNRVKREWMLDRLEGNNS